MSPSPSSRPARRRGTPAARPVPCSPSSCSSSPRAPAATASVAPSASPVAVASPTAAPTATPAPTAEPDARPGLPGDPDRRRGHGRHPQGRAAEDRLADAGHDRDPVRPRRRHRASSPRPTSTTTRRRPSPCPTWPASPSVDVEKIVGLEADLVIAGGNYFNPPDAIAKLRERRRPGPRRLRAGHRGRAQGHRAHRQGGRTARRSGRHDRDDAGRLRRRLGRDGRPAQAADLLRARHLDRHDLHGRRRLVQRRDDRARRRRRRSRPGARPTSSIPLEKLITADPELILLGDARVRRDRRPGQGTRRLERS